MSEPIFLNFTDNQYAEEKIELEEISISSKLDLSLSMAVNNSAYERPGCEKYLIFRLEDKYYGIISERVSEVLNSLKITPLPNAPAGISGIANLRGSIITVVDLRSSSAKDSRNEREKLLIFQSSKTGEQIALAVDKVSEVAEIRAATINFSAEDFENNFPPCLGKTDHKSRTILLLDVEKLLSSPDLSAS